MKSDLGIPWDFVKQGESEAIMWAAAHMHCWQIRIYSSMSHLLQSRDCHSHRLGPSHCSKGHSFLPFCHLTHPWAVTQSSQEGQAGSSCSALCPLQLPMQKRHSSDAHEHTVSSRLLLNTEMLCRCTVSLSSSSLLLPGYTTHLPQHLSALTKSLYSQTRQTSWKTTQAKWNCFKWINSWSDAKSKAGVRSKHKRESLFSTATHLDSAKWSMKLFPEDSPTMFGRVHPSTSRSVYIYPSLFQLNCYPLGFLHS